MHLALDLVVMDLVTEAALEDNPPFLSAALALAEVIAGAADLQISSWSPPHKGKSPGRWI
jgi:hypothetical protein